MYLRGLAHLTCWTAFIMQRCLKFESKFGVNARVLSGPVGIKHHDEIMRGLVLNTSQALVARGLLGDSGP